MIRATIVFAVLVVGCGDDFHPTKWTDDPYARPPTHADPEEPRLSIDGSTAITTCHPNLPLQGWATPEADVYAIVGNTPSSICPANSQTGRYCIDVPLLEGSQQVLVYARHPKLGLIGPEPVDVVYDPSCADQQTAPPPQTGSDEKNIAVHAPIKSMNEPDINPRTYVNDGDKDTWTKWSKFEYLAFKDYMWIMLSLDNAHRIEKINIKWRDSKGVGEQYAADYVLLYTDQDNPGDPNPANQIWQEREVVGGDGGLDPFPIGGDIVRHVALWMFQDASSVVEGYEHYAISEIEVWTKKNGLISNEPSPNAGQTCSTIGSGY